MKPFTYQGYESNVRAHLKVPFGPLALQTITESPDGNRNPLALVTRAMTLPLDKGCYCVIPKRIYLCGRAAAEEDAAVAEGHGTTTAQRSTDWRTRHDAEVLSLDNTPSGGLDAHRCLRAQLGQSEAPVLTGWEITRKPRSWSSDSRGDRARRSGRSPVVAVAGCACRRSTRIEILSAPA